MRSLSCSGMLVSAWLALFPAVARAETAEDRIIQALGEKEGFLWGAASSAYQYEGAWNKDGRQKSIWDVFAQGSGHTHNNENGNVAVNFYEHYKSDVQRLMGYGFNAFRFSISWTRVFTKGPDGKRRANPKGVRFYKNIIGALAARNMTPIVTMYHWDLPADMDWLDASVVDAFAEYADFLFRTFPEVRHWITVNEPWTFCFLGYGLGLQAPGVKSEYEKYRCGHNALLAHARAVEIYRKKYLKTSKGEITAALNYDFAFPRNPSDPQDQQAAQLCHDFNLGWFADPIYLTGDYPASMRQRLGGNLPHFTEEQKALIKGSYEGFYGLNLYAGQYAFANQQSQIGYGQTFQGLDGKMIGEASDPGWLFVVPRALKAALEYVHGRYKVPKVLITENGCVVPGEEESNLPREQSLQDTFRVNYYRDYLDNVASAVRSSKVPVAGYFAWSLMDNFEWAYGFSRRFGIEYVDYATEKRYPKASAKWFADLLRRRKPLHAAASARGGGGATAEQHHNALHRNASASGAAREGGAEQHRNASHRSAPHRNASAPGAAREGGTHRISAGGEDVTDMYSSRSVPLFSSRPSLGRPAAALALAFLAALGAAAVPLASAVARAWGRRRYRSVAMAGSAGPRPFGLFDQGCGE